MLSVLVQVNPLSLEVAMKIPMLYGGVAFCCPVYHNFMVEPSLRAAGVDAPYLCRGGACGRCELEVVCTDGNILHHDHYLSDAEKAAGKKIMPCVSRAKCDLLEVVL